MAQRRTIFFVLFTVSGFSGLIYESIWTHYLKLFLGHAAYAQSLVLAIFMGGLSLGSWISSRYSGRWNNLFRGYALAEGAVGVLALLFHPLFVSSINWSFDVVIPALPSVATVNAYEWTLAALLILPQSVLLGMTFPLLSAAMIRAFPESPGRSLALLYFTNSIGAAVGVLASGFVLIRAIGLPGTIAAAGIINLAIAAAVWVLAPGTQPAYAAEAPGERGYGPDTGRRFLLITSFVTGAASFIYEIGWIRMLSLVLGSSTHAFELMLSAFILGLALGGLWVQRRIEHLENPVRFLSAVQIIMGLSALATLLLYGRVFGVMQWVIAELPKTDAGYLLFNLASNGVAIAIMLPATFCAGMTLPLITYVLLKRGGGESSIGSVYAVNTIGAIAGVFFAIHVGLPLFEVKDLIAAGAVLDMGLGLLLLAWSVRTSGSGRPVLKAAAAVCLAAAVAVVLFVPLDHYSMASGVYRLGRVLDPRQDHIVFYNDGETATVSVVEHHEREQTYRSIRTNGKPDASLGVSIPHQARPDEPTMVLAAALPLAYHPGARAIANIGFGSGLTSHTVLLDPAVESLDSIEIEREMVKGARHFAPLNRLAYEDPRSRITIDDAKTFFSSHRRKYDVIISEPSNPWVSGVASLFTEEFYRQIVRYLNRSGVFVQWIQLYEIDMNLVSSVFKAMAAHFADFVVYTPNGSDMIIVAAKEGTLTANLSGLFSNSRMAEALAGVHIRGTQDIEARRAGSKGLLMPLFDLYTLPANSDYYPVLSQNAARARFLGTNAMEMLRLAGEPLPVMEMLSGSVRTDGAATSVTRSPFHPKTEAIHTAIALRDFLLRRPNALDGPYRSYAEEVVKMFSRCGGAGDPDRRKALFDVAKSSLPYLTPAESAAIWKQLESGRCQAGFTDVEKNYVALFKAIGARNGKRMAGEAEVLLEQEQDITPARSKYVLAAGLLGFIAEHDRQGAEALLRTYRDRRPGAEDFFLLRFLTAQIGRMPAP